MLLNDCGLAGVLVSEMSATDLATATKLEIADCVRDPSRTIVLAPVPAPAPFWFPVSSATPVIAVSPSALHAEAAAQTSLRMVTVYVPALLVSPGIAVLLARTPLLVWSKDVQSEFDASELNPNSIPAS